MDNTQILLDKLTKAVTFKFKEDKTAPGITVSALKKGYYCSVVRYSGAFAKGKIIVCTSKADSLDAAIKSVAMAFLILTDTKPDPLQELNNLVRGN